MQDRFEPTVRGTPREHHVVVSLYKELTQQQLQAVLLEYGIADAQALHLVATRDPAQIQSALELLRQYARRRPVANPAGFLTEAIRQGWAVPAGPPQPRVGAPGPGGIGSQEAGGNNTGGRVPNDLPSRDTGDIDAAIALFDSLGPAEQEAIRKDAAVRYRALTRFVPQAPAETPRGVIAETVRAKYGSPEGARPPTAPSSTIRESDSFVRLVQRFLQWLAVTSAAPAEATNVLKTDPAVWAALVLLGVPYRVIAVGCGVARSTVHRTVELILKSPVSRQDAERLVERFRATVEAIAR